MKANIQAPELYSQESVKDPMVYARLFTKNGFQWLVTEFDSNEQLGFGLCDLGEPELGYVYLPELKPVIVQEDKDFIPMRLSEAIARYNINYNIERKTNIF